jgi:hypothetical protein
MARYEHLPIDRKAPALSVYLEDVVRGFSRYRKYAIGAEMRAGALSVPRLIVRANNRRAGRAATLEDLRLTIEELKTVVHVAKEIKAFPGFNSFAHASELVVDLARQNGGRLKQQQQNPKDPERRQLT